MRRKNISIALVVSVFSMGVANSAPQSSSGGKTSTVAGLVIVDNTGKTVGKYVPGSNNCPAVQLTVGTAIFGVNLGSWT